MKSDDIEMTENFVKLLNLASEIHNKARRRLLSEYSYYLKRLPDTSSQWAAKDVIVKRWFIKNSQNIYDQHKDLNKSEFEFLMSEVHLLIGNDLETWRCLNAPIERNRGNLRPFIRAERFLHLFTKPEDREVIDGDLYEEYDSVLEQHGRYRASFCFCKRVLKSLWPLLKQRVTRKLFKRRSS